MSVPRARLGPVKRIVAGWALGCMVCGAGCTWPPAGSGAAPNPPPGTLRVSSVADGDTFTGVADSGRRTRVRLLGIDAPEASRDGEPGGCGADRATAELGRLIAGRTVALTADPVADGSGRYGRLLAYATVDDQDVALALLEAGMAGAWYPSGEPRPTRYPQYLLAELRARASGAGLWASCSSVGR